jgi:hypothetical protein
MSLSRHQARADFLPGITHDRVRAVAVPSHHALAGYWIFSRRVCLKAPCFATIVPRFVALEPGRCEVRVRDRRRVHNIGTVRAIALCNLAELGAGVMTDATIPAWMRWIPKGNR